MYNIRRPFVGRARWKIQVYVKTLKEEWGLKKAGKQRSLKGFAKRKGRKKKNVRVQGKSFGGSETKTANRGHHIKNKAIARTKGQQDRGVGSLRKKKK